MEKIGQGKSAEIFDLGGGQLLKLFFLDKLENYHREIEVHPHVEQMSLPTLRIADVVDYEGRPGIVFDGALFGRTVGQIVRTQPWRVVEMAHLLADLHSQIHRNSTSQLPSFESKLERVFLSDRNLTEETREKLLRAVAAFPEGDTLCHGDFHMDNVIVGERGVLIIDWSWASRGNPACDISKAIACLQYENLDFPYLYRKLQRPIRHLMTREYMRRYLANSNVSLASSANILKIVDLHFRLRQGPRTRARALEDASKI